MAAQKDNWNVQRELARQLVHLSGLILFFLSFFITFENLIGIIFLFFLVSFIYYPCKRHFFKGTKPGYWEKYARPNEKREKILHGPTYFFLGLLLVLVLFKSVEIYRVAVITLAIGDAFSTIFGTLYGKHKLPYNPKKSFEGALAFFISVFIGLITFIPAWPAFIVAFAGAFFESLPLKHYDNFTIPVLTGIIYWLCTKILLF